MNSKARIEKEVKKTMDLLVKEKPIKTDPFFYTRLKARIKEEETSKQRKLIRKPIGWKIIVTAGMVVLNIITAAILVNSNDVNRQKLKTVFSEEYTLTSETGDLLSRSIKE